MLIAWDVNSGIRPILVALGLVLCASGARAFPQCEEESSAEPAQAAPFDVEAPPPGAVLPCAMVESGVLGPACTDATFYVVTDAGVLLCTVDVDTFDTFALAQAPTRSVEDSPAAPAGTVGAGLAGFAVVPDSARLPPCLARDLPRAPGGVPQRPLDRTDRPPVPPS